MTSHERLSPPTGGRDDVEEPTAPPEASGGRVVPLPHMTSVELLEIELALGARVDGLKRVEHLSPGLAESLATCRSVLTAVQEARVSAHRLSLVDLEGPVPAWLGGPGRV